jgi:hypothetical protein
MNRRLNGRDPVKILCTELDYGEAIWEPHTGPIAGSEQYVQQERKFQ